MLSSHNRQHAVQEGK